MLKQFEMCYHEVELLCPCCQSVRDFNEADGEVEPFNSKYQNEIEKECKKKHLFSF